MLGASGLGTPTGSGLPVLARRGPALYTSHPTDGSSPRYPRQASGHREHPQSARPARHSATRGPHGRDVPARWRDPHPNPRRDARPLGAHDRPMGGPCRTRLEPVHRIAASRWPRAACTLTRARRLGHAHALGARRGVSATVPSEYSTIATTAVTTAGINNMPIVMAPSNHATTRTARPSTKPDLPHLPAATPPRATTPPAIKATYHQAIAESSP